MKPVYISAESLSSAPRAFSTSIDDALEQQTRFSDLPLPARLLLAVPRVRGHAEHVPIPERYVLDTLGRIIDASPNRRHTIQAVNILADVLLQPKDTAPTEENPGPEWLSAVENLVLCVLCKVRNGHIEQAHSLANHWLEKSSVQDFQQAASSLCSAECFKRAGPHVFTPSCSSSPTAHTNDTTHRSVVSTSELCLGESVLLNALRLRKRTLCYAGVGKRVVPLMRQHLALPDIEVVLDALLVETLQFGYDTLDVRCLCCTDISVCEAQFLSAMAAFGTGSVMLIERELDTWLPDDSVERLLSHAEEFQNIVSNLGAPVPLRTWNLTELQRRAARHHHCAHLREPAMIH